MSESYVPDHGDDSFDVTHYALGLAYKVVGNRLDGDAALSCVARADATSVTLDLAHLRVSRVLLDGKPARYSHRGSRLKITAGLEDGQEFELRVKYGGSPRTLKARHLDDAGWEELTDGVIVAAQPHGAPTWFPCNDRPSNKATYAVTLAAPTDYYVAMCGRLTDQRRRGSVTEWTWEMAQPMASYLATVQIGRYEVRELDHGVVVIAPPDLSGEAYDASFGQQPAMMSYFESVFGDYPFDAYTVVVTDDPLEIPLESQSLSTFGRNFASADWDAVRLVAHELAHQWFGNAVTLTEWKDIWLHEGFACYAEWLWSEESGGDSAADCAAHHHAKLADLDQDLLLADPGPALMFDDRVYKRGALTLHALRTAVGDDQFFDVLHEWVERFGGGNATTVDFEAVVEDVTGESHADLFDAWLRELPLPALPD
ncbi:Peptidase family M1 [Nocardioides alpinus]|uniref:Aminopeptidase N n=1 Tax=Nocardioides alpinus TaxID=748909 RepID=A0A1I1A5S7_9ACTN|nr:M1 family metallopeptidase [Nocardioides alpinus]PKH42167.1 M1 family peptidase [Nocardioides alpinus]SFB31928.1 Peptidase family M1 [Nocardioides alpinus]